MWSVKRTLFLLIVNLCSIISTFAINTVVLKQNIIGESNFLSQEMINKDSSVYVFLHDYVLCEDIEIPVGCTLKFDGGSIAGRYTIRGNNTKIKAGVECIFSVDITIAGTWFVTETYPEWFGAKGDGIFDDAIAINKCFLFSSSNEETPLRLLFTKPNYNVDKIISFSGKNHITIEGTAKNTIKKAKGSLYNMFDGEYCKCIKLSNLTLDGSLEDWGLMNPGIPNWLNKTFNACIIGASNTTDFTLDNCVIKNFFYGVYLGGADEYDRIIDGNRNTDYISITNCIFERNKRSCIDTYNRFGLYINNNLFKDNGNIAVHIEPSMRVDLSGDFDCSDVFLSKYPADGVSISNNTFVWTKTPAMGIKLYKGAYAVNISNNHFINSSCAISSDSTKIVIISNNTIRSGKGMELYGKLGSGNIYGNILINVSEGISCSNNSQSMGCLDVHDNIIVYKEKLTSAPDVFKVQNSKYHDNIIRGYFNYELWKKKGVLDVTGASNCEIYNNKLLKCNDSTIPFFVVPITNQEELSSFIKKGVRIFDNVYEQKLDYEFSTDVAKTRPSNPYIGQQFYDLNLNKLIIYVGKNWVDFNGNVVN